MGPVVHAAAHAALAQNLRVAQQLGPAVHAALAQNLRVAHLAVLGQQQLDPAVRAAAAQSLLAHLAVAAAVLGQQQMGAAAVEVVLVVAAVAPGHSFRNGEVLRPDRPPLSTLVGSRS
jgi:hypothetical protein